MQLEMVVWSVMALLVPLATLVAVAVLGRRYRPEAHRPLLAWAIASLAFFVFEHVVPWIVMSRFVVSADGFHQMQTILIVWTTLVSLGHLALVALFARGLARILRPSFANEVRA